MTLRVLLAALLLVVIVPGITACGSASEESVTESVDTEDVEGDVTTVFSVTTSAFESEATIPSNHAREGAGGNNVSIPYEWADAPEGTRSFALVLMDLHPIAHRWIHWMVVDVPADINAVEEGASGTETMPSGSRELANTWGDIGYGGPEPPEGSGGHEYRMTVYALDVEQLDIADDAELRGFLDATEDRVLAEASIVGVYSK